MNGKKAHFVGIAGMGMSAVAILLKEQGWDVTGSDAEMYPPATTQLDRHGIPYATSYAPENIPKEADLIIIGKNAKLTRENNAEVAAAYGSGIRIASFPEILGEITKNRSPIVVAGSYGKSTTTSLLAWLLSKSGIDAGWFIGASPDGMEPTHLGTAPVFILEGDEYPTSHEDSRPKFAHYAAHDVLLTAASHDHVNVYPTHEEFLEPFRSLLRALPADGILAYCDDEPNAAALATETKARVISYGLETGTIHAANIIHGEQTAFDLMNGDTRMARLTTNLLGDHNIRNIVGAAALLLQKNLLTPEQIATALSSFTGLARRLDKKTVRSTVPAHEGFGSSREKLQAAIQAMKKQYPDKRLIVVFEPHTFSWRNKNMLHWFDDAFAGTNLVVLYKPAEQGADTHEQSTQEEMVARLKATGMDVEFMARPEEVMTFLQSNVHETDAILLSSSGPMDGLIETIPRWLDETFA
jgi:UDP-N-acetylmuramate: L-alanyl-gamma-D-glutamyl-meso-diaminopimelate ligase